MMAPAPHQSPADHSPENWVQVAVCFTLEGDLRYLSHHDEIRMLARTLSRARWPVAYSLGFNPQPRLVLPVPRSVGLASECEWAMVTLAHAARAGWLAQTLADALPAGCRLVELLVLERRVRPQPACVTWLAELDADEAGIAHAGLDNLMMRDSALITRDFGPQRPTRQVEIRPCIDQIDLDGNHLRMRLRYIEQRTARPEEVLQVLGLPAGDVLKSRTRRVEILWKTPLAAAESWPPARERKHVG